MKIVTEREVVEALQRYLRADPDMLRLQRSVAGLGAEAIIRMASGSEPMYAPVAQYLGFEPQKVYGDTKALAVQCALLAVLITARSRS